MYCAADKSSADVLKFHFNEFLSLYNPILHTAYVDDKMAVLNMINETKNIYDLLQKDTPVSQANNLLQNGINSSDDKLIDYIMKSADIYKTK